MVCSPEWHSLAQQPEETVEGYRHRLKRSFNFSKVRQVDDAEVVHAAGRAHGAAAGAVPSAGAAEPVDEKPLHLISRAQAHGDTRFCAQHR